MALHLRAMRDVTCHVRSYSVTWHPTQVNTSSLNGGQRPVLDLPIPEGWKADLVTSYNVNVNVETQAATCVEEFESEAPITHLSICKHLDYAVML